MIPTRFPSLASAALVCLSLFFFAFASQNTDPVAVLDHPELTDVVNGSMTVAEFVKTEGVKLVSENGEHYEVAFFELVYLAKNEDLVAITNRQGQFNERSSELVKHAQPGDTFYFEGIKAKPNGMAPESEWVKVNAIVVRVE